MSTYTDRIMAAKTPEELHRVISNTALRNVFAGAGSDVTLQGIPHTHWRSLGYVPGGYRLHVVRNDHVGVRIIVGCRNFSYAEARAHWGKISGADWANRYDRAIYLYGVLPHIKQMLSAEGWDFDAVPKPKERATKPVSQWGFTYAVRSGAGWEPATYTTKVDRATAETARANRLSQPLYASVGEIVETVVLVPVE